MMDSKHVCEICGKSIKSAKTLSDHNYFKNHYEFRCRYCLEGFPVKEKLYDHEETEYAVHNETLAGIFSPSCDFEMHTTMAKIINKNLI